MGSTSNEAEAKRHEIHTLIAASLKELGIADANRVTDRTILQFAGHHGSDSGASSDSVPHTSFGQVIWWRINYEARQRPTQPGRPLAGDR